MTIAFPFRQRQPHYDSLCQLLQSNLVALEQVILPLYGSLACYRKV